LKVNRHFRGTCQLTFNELHSVISQKTELFITTAKRTSNPEYYKADKIKGNEMGRICSACGEMINTYNFQLGKPEEIRALEKPKKTVLWWSLRNNRFRLWTGFIWQWIIVKMLMNYRATQYMKYFSSS
jgi:hypothetical protein